MVPVLISEKNWIVEMGVGGDKLVVGCTYTSSSIFVLAFYSNGR